jgi:carbamoyl-phosphate synthase large subunit
MSYKHNILVFGAGPLQRSIIKCSVNSGNFTVAIDPDSEAIAKNDSDHFEMVPGSDLEATIEVIRKHNIEGIVTAATDKPLVMMAKAAARCDLPFYSVETAENCTDKFKMKQQFQANGIPCAKGYLITDHSEIKFFPSIIKPLDNSGSRGVFFIDNAGESKALFDESSKHSKTDQVLCEEVIEGREFSVEAVHGENWTRVLQITEKITTQFPHNVEMAHIAPATIDNSTSKEIGSLITKIAEGLGFKFCASHTELKLHKGKLVVIESSPRLGGDYITSHLVPLSTGIDIEKLVLELSVRLDPEIQNADTNFAGIYYIELPQGIVKQIDSLNDVAEIDGVELIQFDLAVGDEVPEIRNSLDRYGHFIIKRESRQELEELKQFVLDQIKQRILVD